jgi:hypothetical protein
VDVVLWKIPRWRQKPFDRSELVSSRFRKHDQVDSSCGDPELDAAFAERRADSGEREYTVRAEHVTIEPRYGLVFLTPLRVLFESLNPKCARWPTARASITALVRARLGDRRLRRLRLASVVSLRDFNETNYWHFFNDVFPKLLVARDLGIPDDVPALVSARLTRAPFYELVAPVLSTFRPIVVQDEDTYVDVDEFFWSATLNYDIQPFDTFLDVLGPVGELPEGNESKAGRVAFITRSPRRARPITNLDEIHAICTSFGIEILDFDAIPPTSAPALMQSFETVIGLHGAGLTNVMFRRGAPTRMAEIVMDDWTDYAYAQLAHHFGFQYRAMLARQDPDARAGTRAFRVDPERFRVFVDDLLALPPTCRSPEEPGANA